MSRFVEGPPAFKVRFGMCECEAIHITLIGTDGKAIATGSLDVKQWAAVVASIGQAIAARADDAIGPTMGTA